MITIIAIFVGTNLVNMRMIFNLDIAHRMSITGYVKHVIMILITYLNGMSKLSNYLYSVFIVKLNKGSSYPRNIRRIVK